MLSVLYPDAIQAPKAGDCGNFSENSQAEMKTGEWIDQVVCVDRADGGIARVTVAQREMDGVRQ